MLPPMKNLGLPLLSELKNGLPLSSDVALPNDSEMVICASIMRLNAMAFSAKASSS